MIKIDEELLINDLLLTAKQLHMHPDSNMLKYDYCRFLELNQLCAMDFYKMLEPSGIVIDSLRLQRLLDKDDKISLSKFVNFLDTNSLLIYDIAINYSKMLEDINHYPIAYYDVLRKYSEKDFIDVILSYYATFGNRIYDIVKKYFDEKRIHMGHPFDGMYGGFFTDLLWLGSGYIFSSFQHYDSLSASSLVHELGHAIDAEMFIFPQKKNNNIFADYLCEVPSATFELGFLDYLKTLKVDIDGARVLFGERVSELGEYSSNLSLALSSNECNVFLDGMASDEKGNEYDIRNDILYGLGYYFALHLNQIRQLDMKEYLKIFNNIITSRNDTDLEECIRMMGISVEDFKNGKYIKGPIEDNFNNIKKRYRHK